MRPTSPDVPPVPRGRNHYLKAYARLVRSLLAALTLTFLLSLEAAHQTVEMIDLPAWAARKYGEVNVVSNWFGFDVAGPLHYSYPEFMLSRLAYEPIVAVLAVGLLCSLALEARERRGRRKP